jgi:hypothetical protein
MAPQPWPVAQAPEAGIAAIDSQAEAAAGQRTRTIKISRVM